MEHGPLFSGRTASSWRFRPRKTGICGWSTPGLGAAKVVLLGEVLKLRWRGPTPPLRVTLGCTGGLYAFEPTAGGHRYTSRAAWRPTGVGTNNPICGSRLASRTRSPADFDPSRKISGWIVPKTERRGPGNAVSAGRACVPTDLRTNPRIIAAIPNGM